MELENYFHILNPNRKNRCAVAQFFKKNPYLNCMWVERTSHPTHLETLVLWAFNEGHHRIAVWGGDGTLSRVVNAIHELHAFDVMTVALVPVGTCNDFARKMNIPKWKMLIHRALGKTAREEIVDVGLLTTSEGTKTFINNAGFGRSQRHAGKRVNAITDIFSFEPKKLDLEWEFEGGRHFESRDALLGVVCNAPFFSGGLNFDRNVEPRDGVLNGFFVPPQSRIKLLLRFMAGRLGGSISSADTLRIDGNVLRVESDKDVFPQIDGELAVRRPVRSIQFSVSASKLRLQTWS